MRTQQARQRIQQEVDLVASYAALYRRRVVELLSRLDHAATQKESVTALNLCIEAVDFLLTSQTQLARSLCDLSSPAPDPDLSNLKLRPAA
jgi:hypothetical protein